jgi:[ribosomal protein S5]-alanine N-acetyltransferase
MRQLKGSFALLAPCDRNNAVAHLAYLNDLPTMENLWFLGPGPGNWTIEDAEKRIASFCELNDTGQSHIYTVLTVESNRVVGQCGFKMIDTQNKNAEYGIIIASSFWRSALATEVSLLALGEAFNQLGLHRISFVTPSSNIRARRMLDSFGCLREGLLRQVFARGDEFVDALLYSLLASEWPNARANLTRIVEERQARQPSRA